MYMRFVCVCVCVCVYVCVPVLRRVSSIFSTDEMLTDNAMISIYPYGDELYALTETPYLFRIDPQTLETKQRVSIRRSLAVR